MALSKAKQAKIDNAHIRKQRAANITAVAITSLLHAPFLDASADREARKYLESGIVGPNLADRFASKQIIP